MLKKTKYLVIFLALLITCMSVAVAADMNETTADYTVTETQLTTDTTSINTELVKTTSEDNNKLTKEKVVKQDANQIEVNDNNFDTYFTSTGLNGVNDGDTISFTSDVTRTTSSYIVNKAVNIEGNNYTLDLNTISGYVSQSNPTYIEFNSGASYSNISYLKFHNTQIYTTTATNVSFDHIDVSVENQGVGRGVGVFSMRSGVINCSVKNSNFDIEENTGCSIIAITLGENCTIDNNTITGQATVGNLVYLNLWGANLNNANGITQNKNNTISNNVITGPETPSDICIAIVVDGPHNHIINNTINYAGKGITGNWAGTYDETTNTTNDYYNDTYTGNGYINNTLNNGATFSGAQRSLVAGNTFSGTATIAKNSTVKNNIFNAATTINQYSNVTNNTFSSTVTLKNNINFKNNNAENSTVYVNGANCDLCGNKINTLIVSDSANPTYVCYDNIFTNFPYYPYQDTRIHWYTHGSRTNILNKNYLRSVKTADGTETIEYDNVNIDDEETFLKYFTYQEQGKLWLMKFDYITGNTQYNLGYFPDKGEVIIFHTMMRGPPYMNYHYSLVCKEGYSLNNVALQVVGSYITVSNMTLVYNYEDGDEPGKYAFTSQNVMMPNGYIIFDHINITFNTGYGISQGICALGNGANNNITLQNSIINVKAPSSNGTFRAIAIGTDNAKIINNTINIEETGSAGTDPSIVAIYGKKQYEDMNIDGMSCIENTIVITGATDVEDSTLCGIQTEGNTNTITNNNITVTSTGTATGVELTGDDSTVTDNYIIANKNYGNNAVTATGENNVVENNRPNDASFKVIAPENANINEATPITIMFMDNNGALISNEIITISLGEDVLETSTTDVNGMVIYNFTPTTDGEVTLTIKHEETGYIETNTSVTINVHEDKDAIIKELNDTINRLTAAKNTSILFDDIGDVKYNTNVTISGMLINEDSISLSNQVVTLTFGDKSVNVTTRNGEFRYTTSFKTLESQTVTATFEGNDKYLESTATTSFDITKGDVIVTFDSIQDVKYGENVTITGKFTTSDGKAISNSNVKVLINGKKYYAKTDKTGKFTLSAKITKTGENNITIGYSGNNNYNAYEINTTVNAEKQDVIVTYDVVDSVKKGDNVTITGTFKDANGNAVKNSNVKIIINGKKYYAKTDSTGAFTFTTPLKTVGDNNLTIGYSGNTNYNSYESVTTIKVTD